MGVDSLIQIGVDFRNFTNVQNRNQETREGGVKVDVVVRVGKENTL